MKELHYVLEHIRPAADWLFYILVAVLRDIPSGKLNVLIIQRTGIKLLLFRYKVCLRVGPDLLRESDHLIAEGRVKHRGSTLCVSEVEIRDGAGTLLCAGTFTLYCTGRLDEFSRE